MSNFQGSLTKTKIFLNLIVLSLALYGVSKRDFTEDKVSFFEKMLIETFAPVQEGTTLFKRKIDALISNYIMIVNAKKENESLKKKIEELDGTIFHLNEVQRENERLKELLKFGEEIPLDKVLAQVIAKNASTHFKVLRINKGAKDGITIKSPVITSSGIVGYIYRVSERYSDILTILDPNNRVDSIVTRTRTHGIVEGHRNYQCRMKHVVRTEPIQQGDEVITAGLGNIYPKGLKVGSITRIEKESYGITQFVVVTPSVDFHRLEEVVVLIKNDALLSAMNAPEPTPTPTPKKKDTSEKKPKPTTTPVQEKSTR